MLRNPYPEIPLPRAPLVLVLAQARIPHTRALGDEAILDRIHDHLREDYPVHRSPRPGRKQGSGDLPAAARFEAVDKSWFVTATPDFVTLTTRSYTSRVEFVGRFRNVLAIFAEVAAIPACDRLGVRYIDRVTDDEILSNLDNYVKRDLLGIVDLPAAENIKALRSVSESLIKTGGSTFLRVLSGVLPPDTVTDSNIKAEPVPSWVFDIDAYSEEPKAFGPQLADEVEQMASDAYQLFRWGVTDTFIRHFGGDI